ncbi:MarR family winged helix-turn-helix transcriptional regulator [Sinomonas terrae]|uniref:MarR family winged helix-turn-helix transcriptional regulator n=1 Tax=Sinomonas terrae TaxID=2908838 RepID=A0ABS9U5T9_9MICC|nr:MarR family winged helix-turn-helix transcriptional regulator [Sinomonas terrae]MCH6471640.1 MarR family winged helix-turn-helix transcriptional regulator [Sinomonas terrae]HKT59096.1 MarR family winged helix-turn-helix transcriptional regulator [Gemmatimonadales bacterium]
MSDLTDAEYSLLLTFRNALRAFIVWSEQEAVKAGLTAQQHQLLLVVRTHNGGASVRDVAAALRIRHHSAVGLVRRAELTHLLERHRDPEDARVVRLSLTPEAAVILERLSRAHLDELQRAAAMLHISEDFLHQLSADFLQRLPGLYTQGSPSA